MDENTLERLIDGMSRIEGQLSTFITRLAVHEATTDLRLNTLEAKGREDEARRIPRWQLGLGAISIVVAIALSVATMLTR